MATMNSVSMLGEPQRCDCVDECALQRLAPNSVATISTRDTYCKKNKGQVLKPKMSVLHRREFDSAHRRLRQAIAERHAAADLLATAESEYRLAAELVEHWERATDSPDGQEAKSDGRT